MSLLQELSLATGLTASDLYAIISSAPLRYKVYEIPKRRGGFRTIAQPAKELKLLQTIVVETKLAQMRVHKTALAYREGRNIGDNAKLHSRGRVFLKLDFEDFFPSLTVRDWRLRLHRDGTLFLDRDDLNFYDRILFWGRGSSAPCCLSIGAPSSPMLSNILMYDIDVLAYNKARELGVIYTRYADDITISGRKINEVNEMEIYVRSIVKKLSSPKLTFNESKRGLFVNGQKHMVTGLIVTPDNRVSIGRDRKRLISSCIHKVALGQTDAEHLAYTRGLLAFARSIEPDFPDRMIAKYGADIIRALLGKP